MREREMDNKEESGSGSGSVVKKPKTKTKTKRRLNPTRKEKIRIIEGMREKGIITRFPKFIPPQLHHPIPPNLTHDQEVEYVFGLFKGPGITISYDVYRGPATAPGQLSLPEHDESARVALYSIVIPERKKKRWCIHRKQKVRVVSSSKKPMTNA